MRQMNRILSEKIKEALTSVIPITVIAIILCFSVAPVPTSTLSAFIFGAILLVVGMGFFTLGAEVAMTPIGEYVGSYITKSRKIWLMIIAAFAVGFIITIAEPDLQVLANQVPAVPNMTLIVAVAVGVGIFLVIALLRVLIGIRLSYLLIGCYVLVFVLSAFVPDNFLSVAFDSGGVTTGPMTVPFIMALGVGVSAIRSDRHAHNDSFGMVALCSIGPILAVLILGMIYKPTEGSYIPVTVTEFEDSKQLWLQFEHALPDYCKEVAVALGPVAGFFLLFQIVALRLNGRQLAKICVGLLYTYLGLVLFLTGVNVGFMPAGNYLGQQIAKLEYKWILIPIGAIIGYCVVSAEPAIHVLTKQVEELTDGAIAPKVLQTSLSVSVAIAIGIAMLRVMTGISIYWFLIPGYAVALVLAAKVSRVFTAIAFDSGGVASGPMTATFVLPFAMGACDALGGNMITDAFGVVAVVAMMPLIVIQLLGLFYNKKSEALVTQENTEIPLDDEIIEINDDVEPGEES